MILSNIEIQKPIDERRLIITPDPQPRSPEHHDCPYDTTAVDLHLGNALAVPQPGPYTFDLRKKGGIAAFLAKNSKQIIIPEEGYALKQGQFTLGTTVERVTLPLLPDGKSLAARIEGKSSLARCGLLVHFTAPTVHAGFDGTLTLEMINLGVVDISLFPGMAIAQLILEAVMGDTEANPSQFQGQSTPAGTPYSDASLFSDGPILVNRCAPIAALIRSMRYGEATTNEALFDLSSNRAFGFLCRI